MLRGFFASESMGRNPNWCGDFNEMNPPSFLQDRSSSEQIISHPSIVSSMSLTPWLDNNQLSDSWTQFLRSGGLSGDQEESPSMGSQYHQYLASSSSSPHLTSIARYETFVYNDSFRHPTDQPLSVDHPLTSRSPWSTSTQKVNNLHVSSPRSCITTTSFSSNMLDFSKQKQEKRQSTHHDQSPNSESNSRSSGEAFKKSKIHASCAQSTFKVRKEKLGERITALHQIVSPFGKTDTASVLLEAIGYIRFLHGQIEALSTPYLGISRRHQGAHIVEDVNGARKSSTGAKDHKEIWEEPHTMKDLRSRGLCLVPISCTLRVGGGGDGGLADYWAPVFGVGLG